MKKLLFMGIFAIGTMTMSSCSSNCCTLLTAKICEDDFDSSVYSSWDEAKASLETVGYNCD